MMRWARRSSRTASSTLARAKRASSSGRSNCSLVITWSSTPLACVAVILNPLPASLDRLEVDPPGGLYQGDEIPPPDRFSFSGFLAYSEVMGFPDIGKLLLITGVLIPVVGGAFLVA